MVGTASNQKLPPVIVPRVLHRVIPPSVVVPRARVVPNRSSRGRAAVASRAVRPTVVVPIARPKYLHSELKKRPLL